jgi:hypothetical protein
MTVQSALLTSLGYEPYDARLWRPGQSLAGVVTSADRTDYISLRRLRLPRPALSRRVRFINRFTEQAIDLRFPPPHPSSAAAACPSSRNDHVEADSAETLGSEEDASVTSDPAAGPGPNDGRYAHSMRSG